MGEKIIEEGEQSIDFTLEYHKIIFSKVYPIGEIPELYEILEA